MWKEYSLEYIRKNKNSGISVMIAACIAALFLSLLCGLSFNMWKYEVERIVREEGTWQGRLTGEISEEEISLIENFANVEKAEIDRSLSKGTQTAVNLCFKNKRMIYRDMPAIAKQLEMDETAISYHELLLSRYLIHDPQDENPPLLLAFYLIVLLLASLSLVLIIHHSFAVSMQARIHQFGIFSSVGATPRQILTCLMQEAFALCLVPILAGSVLGIAGSFGLIQCINGMAKNVEGRHDAVFSYPLPLLLLTVGMAVLTVLLSAWIPARRLSRCTPLEAIRQNGDLQLKRKKRSRILSLLFGIEGELAGNALKAQKKALRTTTWSLTFSFLGFSMMLCFFTLAGISTNHTYFERYQDAWDVMVTMKDTDIDQVTQAEEIRALSDVQSSVVYQKAQLQCVLPKDAVSQEVQSAGGLEQLAGSAVAAEAENFLVLAPAVIMDDAGFAQYCEQLGIAPQYDGSIVLNRIWDSANSNFRYKKYVPFIREEQEQLNLCASEGEGELTLPVLAYTQEPPVLREEYENYALVQILPLSMWAQIKGELDAVQLNAVQSNAVQPDTYIRILASGERTAEQLDALEAEIRALTGGADQVEIENRIADKKTDEELRDGMMVVLGAFCAVLAAIGIANIFSNTLGFLRQRKREFARYFSIGMTPQGMRRMFCIEAVVICMRPLLITLPLTVLSVGFMITASYLDPAEFLEKAPILPMALFLLAIWICVALAYYIGGKRMQSCDLTEALRNDSMV